MSDSVNSDTIRLLLDKLDPHRQCNEDLPHELISLVAMMVMAKCPKGSFDMAVERIKIRIKRGEKFDDIYGMALATITALHAISMEEDEQCN